MVRIFLLGLVVGWFMIMLSILVARHIIGVMI